MKRHNYGLCKKCGKMHVHPMLNKHPSDVTRQKMKKAHIDKHPSKPTLEKLSVAMTGDKNPNYGKHQSEAAREKQRIKMTGKLVNEKHPNWKGDDVKYQGLHGWMRKHKPKSEFCEMCLKKKKLELANISGEYHHRDVNDYLWLCRKCHRLFDGLIPIKKGASLSWLM